MANEQVMKLSDREFDAAVAERVMGWRNVVDADGYGHWSGDPPAGWQDFHGGHCEDELPYFGTDPAADYAVLVHVRQTWDELDTVKFIRALEVVWSGRCSDRGLLDVPPFAYLYQPGDYAKSALLALEEPDHAA